MQIKTFKVPLGDTSGVEDELNKFLRSHRVLKLERAFCLEGSGYLAVCVEYMEGKVDGSVGSDGKDHFFTIYDPKKRIICAAPFATRVVFHALMNVCEPVLERYQIHDSYACRKVVL